MANCPTVPGHDDPLPDDLVGSARALILKARSAQTRHVYRGAWTRFEAWCRSHGRRPLPASVDTIAGWMTSLAQDGKAPASINTYLSAVIVAHRTAGFVIDRKAQLLADIWRGIANEGVRVPRQARPITAPVLRDLLAGLDPSRPGDARDSAVLALGWAAALRRSELVGLDWQEQGDGSGFVGLDERGLALTLIRSKSSPATPVTIAVPHRDMPDACLAVQTWVVLAALEPGSPLFRAVDRAERIGTARLSDRSVARIIKSRVCDRALAKGAAPGEAEVLAAQFSGHSLRAGYATSAAAADVPGYRIQQHTRHKTAEMVARYVREADKWTKSGLKGVW